jgi:biotin-dependent carboxylase-like uncharacterized protein
MNDRTLEVLEAGPLSTVQDRGRVGWAHLGVPRAGALDQGAAALANRLVGNDAAAAVVETTLGGIELRASTALTVAVCGADCDVRVGGRAAPFAEPLSVPAGATVRLGPARSGVRSYLAVAGGIAVPPVLGSRSTDTLAGIGPPVLAAGDVLPVGGSPGPPAAVDAHAVRRAPSPVVVRLVPGPRVDWFAGDVLVSMASAAYTVLADSNRVALRLDGPVPQRARAGELPSEGLALGAVQVTPSGRPLVFLRDHPTTGGYPVVGVVPRADLDLCAQLRPGEQIRFRPA